MSIKTICLSLAILTSGSAAFADEWRPSSGQRIVIGDLNLSAPAGVAEFGRRVERAGQAICREHMVGTRLVRPDCLAAVRQEAEEQLSPAQKLGFAQAGSDQRTWLRAGGR